MFRQPPKPTGISVMIFLLKKTKDSGKIQVRFNTVVYPFSIPSWVHAPSLAF